MPEMGSLWESVAVEVSAHSDLRIHNPSPGKQVWLQLSGKPIRALEVHQSERTKPLFE